jgi:regulatory protein
MPGRKSRPPDAGYLERAAYAYLGRFATSRGNIERVLINKARRRADRAGVDWNDELRSDMGDAITALLDKLERLELIDDRHYAEAKSAALHALGRSARAIQAALMSKGVARDLIHEVLAAQFPDSEASEMEAATRYAQRRRFGPFRQRDKTPDRHRKDLAAMARAGFSYQIAKKVLEPDDS